MREAELDEIERRSAASGPPAGLRVSHDKPTTLAVGAYDDVQRLISALRESRRPPDAELDAIAARAEAAGPLPWPHFLESDPAMAGSSLAPDADFVLIAHAREDIPRLVAAARALGA